MTHFIMKLINDPHPADPLKDALDVHKHFTRYSKGEFEGPLAKISQTKSKISVNTSYEMEDEALSIALDLCEDDVLTVSGTLISSGDFTKLMKEMGLSSEWYPSKSKGKAANYNTQLKAVAIEREKLKEMLEKYRAYIYFLLSFSSKDKSITLTTKKKPPRPNSKNPEDSKPANKLKFCSLRLPNTPENMERVIKGYLDDVRDEIPTKWKSILVEHRYKITELKLPENFKKMPSRQVRLRTLRKGILKRSITIDGTTINKEIEFTV